MAASNNPTTTAPTVITSESNITAGELKVNNAYDLTLLKNPDGNYELQLYMKLQFFFKNDGISKWNTTQQQTFLSNWELKVRNSWDNTVIKVLSGNKTVKLKLKFKIKVGGFMFDHWEITVKKVPAGSTFRSFVNPGKRNVMLTENDNKIVVRHTTKNGSFKQTTTVHEFGHMIGLDDEYGPDFGGKKGINSKDYGSLMNIGSNIRNRHKNSLLLWLNNALTKNNIK